MSHESSDEELRRQRIEAMGEPVGEVHFLLWQEAVALHVAWTEFKTLYAESEETVDLLNSVARAFFGRVQELMWHGVVLSLCRLCDPPATGGKKKNLSLGQLSSRIEEPNLRVACEERVEEAKKASSFARDWRNRHVAHNSLKLALEPDAYPLEDATRRHVEDALLAIAAALNVVSEHFGLDPTPFDHSIEPLGGAGTLLHRLREIR